MLICHQPAIECAWMRESVIDWICQAPAAACLIVNLIFLIRIMWVSTSIILVYKSNGNSICATATIEIKFTFLLDGLLQP